MQYSMLTESSFELRNSWAWTLSGLEKNVCASSFISVDTTLPIEDAMSIMCWYCGGTFLNNFIVLSELFVCISVIFDSTS